MLYNSGVVFRVCVGSMECNFPFAMHFLKVALVSMPNSF